MIKKRRKRVFLSSLILLYSISLFGCSNDEEEIKKVKIDNGAIAIENSGNYSIYNLADEKYEKVETDYIITSYDSKSENFIYNEDGKFKVNYLGKEKDIENSKNITAPKLSIGGDYLSYFVREDYLNLKIKNLRDDKDIDFKSNVAISGELIDWLNEDTLVYYGIDDSRNNGIFIYNISENKEKLLYKLDLGYVEYLKVIDDGIVFVQEKEEKQRTLKFIDENANITESIDNIIDISDVEVSKDGIYILGRIENNNYSLYKYNNGSVKRLVYDFPKIINLEKGLSKDSSGNILFIGGDDTRIEKLYKCEDGTISTLDVETGTYNFIDYS
ncbi:hypothetical protein ACQPVP_09435 [Clostridium nigeriense]|uniref:hypothetical protein n=1 Tax=Clostridium nigeriense TaxID=1805470 RepID=UPI003D34DC39